MIKLNGYEIKPTIFPDGTSQVWKIPEEVLLANPRPHISWKYESEAELIHLVQLNLLLVEDSRIEGYPYLSISYLPYARQDKPIDNQNTFALRALALVLNSLAWAPGGIQILDPHSQVALDSIQDSNPIWPTNAISDAYRSEQAEVMCLPDAGAVAKYSKFFPLTPHVHAEKVRDQATGQITSLKLVGDVEGLRVLIVDDICDGGQTFVNLAVLLYEAGAMDVSLYVTHGLFTQGTQRLYDAGISQIYTYSGKVSP